MRIEYEDSSAIPVGILVGCLGNKDSCFASDELIKRFGRMTTEMLATSPTLVYSRFRIESNRKGQQAYDADIIQGLRSGAV